MKDIRQILNEEFDKIKLINVHSNLTPRKIYSENEDILSDYVKQYFIADFISVGMINEEKELIKVLKL